ncbi:MAG: phosphoribosylamine--glycine ligase, partial [Calditrichaeota bacterium]|nr:phosphoribosylamine--glycine ligase [Calditrichota bacterium]
MKVLIVGSGGREHALAWACSRSNLKPSIICVPGNGGTIPIAHNLDKNPEDISQLADFIKRERIDLTIIGPEAPLVSGLADKITGNGQLVFGPSALASRMEGSKAFSKKALHEAGVPTADFQVFTDFQSARSFIESTPSPLVIKASGLAAGKGVIICDTKDLAVAAAEGMLTRDAFGASGRKIVIEECLTGKEISLLALVDGTDYILLPPSRDHKRALDFDRGPNTGGMGAYAPLDDISSEEFSEIAKQVFPPILKWMADSGINYQGCLFAGIMLTPTGPSVLEFNCRFGDPETQAVLPLLNYDILELMLSVAESRLGKVMQSEGFISLLWEQISKVQHSVCVVAVADGYPGSYKKDIPIDGLPDENDDVIPFHAGTAVHDNKLLTSGGRVLAITGLGDTHDDAVKRAYQAIEEVKFESIRYRR